MNPPQKNAPPSEIGGSKQAKQSESNIIDLPEQQEIPAKNAITHYEPHPLALLLPAMDDEPLAKMADDIKQVGQRDPIVLYEGKILDGVQRQAACEKANVIPSYSHWEHLPEWKRKAGPLAFIMSLNLHRRHLTTKQRSEIAAKIVPMLREQAIEQAKDKVANQTLSRKRAPKGSGDAVKKAADMMKVSPDSVRRQQKQQGQNIEKRKSQQKGKLLNGD